MIFLDSSFLISLEVEKDENHQRAIDLRSRILKGDFGSSVISDYIFDETMTVTFGRTKDLGKAVAVGVKLKDPSILIKLEESDFESAWDLFKNQKNTKLSFTDCTNLAIMKRMSIKDIAAFDEDFKKIGGINVIS